MIWTSSLIWRPRFSAGPADCHVSSALSQLQTWSSPQRSPRMDSRSRFSDLSSDKADGQISEGKDFSIVILILSYKWNFIHSFQAYSVSDSCMYDILGSVHFTQLNKGFCTFVKILVVLCFTSLNCPSSNFFSHTQSPWKRHHVVTPDSKFVLSVLVHYFQKCCRMEIDNLTSIKRFL